MSATIAGESCKKCGDEYYVSLGHPKWFDDVIKRDLPFNDTWKAFCRFAASGECPDCYLSDAPAYDWTPMTSYHGLNRRSSRDDMFCYY